MLSVSLLLWLEVEEEEDRAGENKDVLHRAIYDVLHARQKSPTSSLFCRSCMYVSCLGASYVTFYIYTYELCSEHTNVCVGYLSTYVRY